MQYDKQDLRVLRKIATSNPMTPEVIGDILRDMKHLNIFKTLPLHGVFHDREKFPAHITLFEACLVALPLEGVGAMLQQHPIGPNTVCASLSEMAMSGKNLTQQFDYAGKREQPEERFVKEVMSIVRRAGHHSSGFSWGQAIDPAYVLAFREYPQDWEVEPSLPSKQVLEALNLHLPPIDIEFKQAAMFYFKQSGYSGGMGMMLLAMLNQDQDLLDMMKNKVRKFEEWKALFDHRMITPDAVPPKISASKKM